jgi:competence protein ComEC
VPESDVDPIADRVGERAFGTRPRRVLAGARRALAASVGAQIGVLPWALPLFCLVTPWAPLANLVAVPWTGLALAVCLTWTALACAAPGAARALSGVLRLVAAPFAWPASVPPRPWIDLAVSVGVPEAAVVAAALLLLAGGAIPWWRERRVRSTVVALALALSVSGLAGVGLGAVGGGGSGGEGRAPSGVSEASGVSAVMIDVGQGDAILLRDGPRAVLVDGGGWRYGDLGGRVLLPVLARLGVRRLDALIVSHPDRDHCGGLVDVAGYLAVGETISGPGIGESRCGRELAALPGFGQPVARRVVGRGAVLRVGQWRLRVLHPALGPHSDGEGSTTRSDNDDSLVVQAEAFGRRLLLTGDIESRAERALVRSAPAALRCDLLKVAHHGSKTSTGAAFLAAASPRVALISAGAHNPYGHPAAEVLARLVSRRVRIVRTDRDGMIVVAIHPDGRIVLELPRAPKR